MAELTAESLRAEISDLQAKQTPRGLVITFNTDVLFDVDRAELKPGAMSEIQRLADALNTDPERMVRIEGHADSTGAEAHNLELSKRRADAVANTLIHDGVMASRISTAGFGASMPVATNDTQAGRQQNRRAEIVVQRLRLGAAPPASLDPAIASRKAMRHLVLARRRRDLARF
jgi:outer membrane protein OmpA-like peptidoglycan-associated protein